MLLSILLSIFAPCSITYNVSHVRTVDGDTFVVDIHTNVRLNVRKTIRLEGWDTPERGQHNYKSAGRVADEWLQSSQRLELLTRCTNAFDFRPTPQAPLDRYGRVLGVIRSEKGYLGEYLYDLGLATKY